MSSKILLVTLLMIARLILGAATASAQDAAKPVSPTHAFWDCPSRMIPWGNLSAKDGFHDAALQKFTEATKCLDAKLSAAIEAAGENGDLKSATKDFYVKAQTALGQALQGRLEGVAEQPFEDASNRLKMEAVAAGKW